jgi:hypothetical protein
MTLVNWYRQSQKQQLLQRVLSHSLAHIVHIYPRYGVVAAANMLPNVLCWCCNCYAGDAATLDVVAFSACSRYTTSAPAQHTLV